MENLEGKQYSFSDSVPARLRVFFKDGTKTYESVEEAPVDLAKRGLPVKVITQPNALVERIQRVIWQPARGRQTSGTSRTNYKERLQVYRRTPV